jgi:hypothetical protein
MTTDRPRPVGPFPIGTARAISGNRPLAQRAEALEPVVRKRPVGLAKLAPVTHNFVDTLENLTRNLGLARLRGFGCG